MMKRCIDFSTYYYNYPVEYDPRTGTGGTFYQIVKMESKYLPALIFQWKAPSSIPQEECVSSMDASLQSLSHPMLLASDMQPNKENSFYKQDKEGRRVQFGPARFYVERSGKVWDNINFTYSVPSIYCVNRQDGRICIMYIAFETDGYLYLYMKFYWPNGQLQSLLRAKSTLLLTLYLDNGDVWEGPDPSSLLLLNGHESLQNQQQQDYCEWNQTGDLNLLGNSKVKIPFRGLLKIGDSILLQKSEVCDWPLEVIHQVLITPKKKGGVGLHSQQLKNLKIYGNMLDMIMMDLKEHGESHAIQEMSKSLHDEYFVAKLVVQWVKRNLCNEQDDHSYLQ